MPVREIALKLLTSHAPGAGMHERLCVSLAEPVVPDAPEPNAGRTGKRGKADYCELGMARN